MSEKARPADRFTPDDARDVRAYIARVQLPLPIPFLGVVISFGGRDAP